MNHLVITGGAGDLAKAITATFHDPHWAIQHPGRHILDVTHKHSVRAYMASREIDLLVCSAGMTHDAPIFRMSEDSWDEVLAVNFIGARTCAEAALPNMIARERGHIVFISSYSALHPPIGQAAYATAKSALLGLTKDLARRHGAHGIRVNAILPGFLETNMTATLADKRRDEILTDHVLGKYNTPQAVAEFIRHLHERLPNTSGQHFQLDSRVPLDG
ncbi:MAG: SDR family oxidoreductase [Akkermansiaceae bacterium]|nr:SDR family oxidoreductase [Akkermansiaceae bacterium]